MYKYFSWSFFSLATFLGKWYWGVWYTEGMPPKTLGILSISSLYTENIWVWTYLSLEWERTCHSQNMLNWGIISAHRKSPHWGHPKICWFLYLDWITTQGYHRFSFIPEISCRYPKSPTGTVASPAVINPLQCYKDLFRRVSLRPQIGVQHLIHGICCKYVQVYKHLYF